MVYVGRSTGLNRSPDDANVKGQGVPRDYVRAHLLCSLAAVEILGDPNPDEMDFLHSVLTQTFLPYRDPRHRLPRVLRREGVFWKTICWVSTTESSACGSANTKQNRPNEPSESALSAERNW